MPKLENAVITASALPMPQISSRAETQYGYPEFLPASPSSFSTSSDGSGFGAKLLSALGGLSGGGLLSLIGNIIGLIHEDISAEKQREYYQKQADTAWRRSFEMWNKTNEYNKPSNQLDRLRDAGLNPLYYGLDGTSANAFEAQQPLAYQRASGSDVFNPFGSAIDVSMRSQLQSAQVRNIEAQTDNILANTDQTYLENKFLEETLQIRVDAEAAKLNLTNEQVKQVQELTRKASKEIEQIGVEMETELAKQILYKSEAALKDGELEKLKVLLPLEANLLRAKTATEKAQASWFAVQTSVENLKIEGKYYDAVIDKAVAEARSTEARADLEEFRNSVKTGDATRLGRWFNEHPNWKAVFPALGFISSDMMRISSILDESGIYRAAGVAVGASVLAGKAPKAAVPGQPGGPAKYTTLYGPDGKPIMTN